MRASMDWVLFGVILALLSLGLVMVYSVTSVTSELNPKKENMPALAGGAAEAGEDEAPSAKPQPSVWTRPGGLLAFLSDFWRQVIVALLALAMLLLLSQLDYIKLQSPAWALSGMSVALCLLIVALVVDKSSRRWLHLGVTIQPSELAKPALIVFLAWFVTMRARRINNKHTVLCAGLAMAAVLGLIGYPDLGTAIVLAAAAAVIFYLAGLNRTYTIACSSAGLVLLTALFFLQPYRVKRVLDRVDPEYKYLVYVDPGKILLEYANRTTGASDTTYHPLQSRIALGGGGLFGRGLGYSRQKFLFLPRAHTDFIFSIIGEELGLWGALLVLIGFGVIMWRGYRLFWSASDEFGKYLAAGVTTVVVVQALLNMSVAADLGPTKGIPLPLISFGGSSLVSTMISLGLLLSVSQRAARQ